MENKLKISENTVVYCETEELAIKVLNIADSLGYTWSTGTSYKENNYWFDNKENTCYDFFKGKYGDLKYHKKTSYNIISAQEFITLHNSLEKSKSLLKQYLEETPKDKLEQAKLKLLNKVFPEHSKKDNEGVKHSKNKPPLYTLLKQFHLAFTELAKCTQAGHLKYIDTDVDYMNYKRVPNAEFEYKNAAIRHLLEEGINQDMLEYGEVLHDAQVIWNLLAALQIKLENETST